MKLFVLICVVGAIAGSENLRHNSRRSSDHAAASTTSEGHDARNSTVGDVGKRYLQKLFMKYGRNGHLSLEGLEHLLDSLGLGEAFFDHRIDHHYHNGTFKDFHEDHDHHDHEPVHDDHNHDHEHHDHDRSHDHDHQHDHDHDPRAKRSVDGSTDECMDSAALFSACGAKADETLGYTDFLTLCPILIYQLDFHTCQSSHFHQETLNNKRERPLSRWTAAEKWGYSILSCVVISLLSLVGAPLIPLMNRVFYNHMLQFMVALAIGTLSGDALLHLLPHALNPHDHSESSSQDHHSSSHLRSVWLGLTAFGGIYLFFVVERIMGVFTTWKRKKLQQHSVHSVEKDAHLPELTDEPAKLPSQQKEMRMSSCEGVTLMVHTSKDVRAIATETHQEVHGDCQSNAPEGFIHSHSNGLHGHSHHGNKLPSSIAAVAWMVIVGDGVHNFSDGLAIGAAFAESMSSGLSTSVAVFCHELPHELGDFAVLLTAGMTVKQALFYNFVSAMLSLLGNIIGVALGNLTSITPWILCLIAGMFLYVALVDMLPELTNMTSKKGESALCHLVLQNAGLIAGATVMLLIAVFEEDLHF